MTDKKFMIILLIIGLIGFYKTTIENIYTKEDILYMNLISNAYKENSNLYCYSEHYTAPHPNRVIPTSFKIINKINKDLILKEKNYIIIDIKENRSYKLKNCSMSEEGFYNLFEDKLNLEKNNNLFKG